MNRLPQEIFDEIGTLLQGPDFDKPSLATVSLQWQAAIEQHTFRHLCLRSTDLDRFQEIVRYRRRRYMTQIDYLVVLPAYSDEERLQFEREDTRKTNDEAFTAAIHGLLHILASWDVCRDGYIELTLRDVYSISDHEFLRHSSPFRDTPKLPRVRRDEENNRITELWNWRHRYSYLRLMHASELPIVPVVNIFTKSALTRNICDRVPIDIAARLPSLYGTAWRMNQWEIRYIALRRRHRHDFTQAVREVLPRSSGLQTLVLQMGSIFLLAPNFSIGTLNLGNSTRDTLSNALRIATASIPTLKRLRISGVIDSSLFWPGPAPSLTEPYWQNLEELGVTFDTRRPSGGCYFQGSWQTISSPLESEEPPGYGHSVEGDAEAAISFLPSEHMGSNVRDRTLVPDDDSLVPLIEAFGRACSQIPTLKLAELYTVLPTAPGRGTSGPSQDRYRWGVWYFSPGTSSQGYGYIGSTFSEDTHRRRLFWTVKDWRPEADLQRLLRGIGSERYGIDVAENFS